MYYFPYKRHSYKQILYTTTYPIHSGLPFYGWYEFMKVFGPNSILDRSQMLMAHIKSANRRHRQDDVNIYTHSAISFCFDDKCDIYSERKYLLNIIILILRNSILYLLYFEDTITFWQALFSTEDKGDTHTAFSTKHTF